MDEYNWRKSGQIPEFGDWERANELPITQYFDNARQAGLIRYSSSSGECDPRRRRADLYPVSHRQPRNNNYYYTNNINNPPRKTYVNEGLTPSFNRYGKKISSMFQPPEARLRENKHSSSPPHVKEQKKSQQLSKIVAVTDPARNLKQQLHWDNNNEQKNQFQDQSINNPTIPRPRLPARQPKPVDEDLYKIPPDLLVRSSKRKKKPGLFSCLVPACASYADA